MTALELTASELFEVAADLETGVLDWRSWDEALTCPDRQEVAAQQAYEAALAAQERERAAKKQPEWGMT